MGSYDIIAFVAGNNRTARPFRSTYDGEPPPSWLTGEPP
jgi:hypothetical protein